MKKKDVMLICSVNQYGNLVTFDSDPLKGRIPIVFIGGNPESDFKGYPLNKYPKLGIDNYNFSETAVKLYVFSWVGDEGHGSREIASGFAESILKAPELMQAETIYIIGLSAGGIIARCALNINQLLAEKVKYIFTLSTPHLGAPLSDPPCVRYSVESMRGLRKLFYYFAYKHLYLTIRANKKWCYDIIPAHSPKYPANLWEETERDLNSSQYYEVTNPSDSDSRLLTWLNSQDKYLDKVIAFAGKSTRLKSITTLGLFMQIWMKLHLWMKTNSMYDFKESDGFVPFQSSIGAGLSMKKVIKYPDNMNHFGYMDDKELIKFIVDHITQEIKK